MKFSTLYILFILFGFIICFALGPAAVLLYGIVFVFVCTCISETCKTKSSEGRKQIQKELKTERKIEQYWGTIEYWEDK